MLSGATPQGQTGLGSDGNKGVLHIPQNSSITGTSPSDLVISRTLISEVLPLCILQPQLTGQALICTQLNSFKNCYPT